MNQHDNGSSQISNYPPSTAMFAARHCYVTRSFILPLQIGKPRLANGVLPRHIVIYLGKLLGNYQLAPTKNIGDHRFIGQDIESPAISQQCDVL